jgi:hypothetical protein
MASAAASRLLRSIAARPHFSPSHSGHRGSASSCGPVVSDREFLIATQLDVDDFHARFGIARPGSCPRWQGGRQAGNVVGRQHDIERA